MPTIFAMTGAVDDASNQSADTGTSVDELVKVAPSAWLSAASAALAGYGVGRGSWLVIALGTILLVMTSRDREAETKTRKPS